MRQGPKGIPRLHANLVRESEAKVNESRIDQYTSNTIVEELQNKVDDQILAQTEMAEVKLNRAVFKTQSQKKSFINSGTSSSTKATQRGDFYMMKRLSNQSYNQMNKYETQQYTRQVSPSETRSSSVYNLRMGVRQINHRKSNSTVYHKDYPQPRPLELEN